MVGAYEGKRRGAPFFKSIPQEGMIAPQDDDEVYPTLRKGIARVPVKDEPARRHERLELVEEL